MLVVVVTTFGFVYGKKSPKLTVYQYSLVISKPKL